jgi:hypothetical protein
MDIRNKWIITACVVIGVLAAGSAGYYFYFAGGPDPANMTAQQIQTYMQSQDFNNMPRQERRVFFEKVMDSRVQGYFKTPEQDREKYLDKIIDDMQNFRPNFDRGPRDPNAFQQMRQRMQNATGAERRLRRETQDPVKRAMQREFGDALRVRAEQRGIQMGGRGMGMGPGMGGGGRGGRGQN